MQHDYTIKPGTICGGYEFKQQIGKGGSAAIYLVESQKFQKEFVAKVVQKTENGNHSVEANFLQKLDTPHIIRIYDTFDFGENAIQIIEYCPYGSVNDVIRKKGPLNEMTFKRYAHDVIQALNFTHANMIAHSDIKPANILIDSMGRAKLADFGIAQNASALSTQFAGSIPFLAPEVLKKRPYDAIKADIWALGVTFYVMLEGKTPWPSNSDEAIPVIKAGMFEPPKKMSSRIAKIVALMLSLDPDRRPTIAELTQMPDFVVCPRNRMQRFLSSTFSKNSLPIGLGLIREKSSVQSFNLVSPDSRSRRPGYHLRKCSEGPPVPFFDTA